MFACPIRFRWEIAKLAGDNQYLKIRHRGAMAREIFKADKQGNLGKQLFFGVGAIFSCAIARQYNGRKILRFISFQQAQMRHKSAPIIRLTKEGKTTCLNCL
jgi:hypothetical protein